MLPERNVIIGGGRTGAGFARAYRAARAHVAVVEPGYHRPLGDRFAPPRLLRDTLAAGELGRTTGRGSCTYD